MVRERRFAHPSGPAAPPLEDPIFGRLDCPLVPGWWEGQFRSEAFAAEIDLAIAAPGCGSGAATPPDERQRRLFLEFRRREAALRPVVEQALFDYYRTLQPDRLDTGGELPGAVSAAELWQHLRPTCLHLPDPTGEPGHEILILAFETPWEPLYGTEVRFVDWQIEHVR